jgi:hypothetical protein
MIGNMEAMGFWLHVQTQWRAGGFGPVGLDYPAVRGEARALGLYLNHGLMRKLQAMERHILKKNAPEKDGNAIKGGNKGTA